MVPNRATHHNCELKMYYRVKRLLKKRSITNAELSFTVQFLQSKQTWQLSFFTLDELFDDFKDISLHNLFHTNILFLYPSKTLENNKMVKHIQTNRPPTTADELFECLTVLWFSDVFKWYKNGALVWNGLRKLLWGAVMQADTAHTAIQTNTVVLLFYRFFLWNSLLLSIFCIMPLSFFNHRVCFNQGVTLNGYVAW